MGKFDGYRPDHAAVRFLLLAATHAKKGSKSIAHQVAKKMAGYGQPDIESRMGTFFICKVATPDEIVQENQVTHRVNIFTPKGLILMMVKNLREPVRTRRSLNSELTIEQQKLLEEFEVIKQDIRNLSHLNLPPDLQNANQYELIWRWLQQKHDQGLLVTYTMGIGDQAEEKRIFGAFVLPDLEAK